jgi:hypothetical protein
MDIAAEILRLQKSRLLRNSLEVRDFESAIENIVSLKDYSLIKDLCTGFDDKTENHEVMFGLVHVIEDFEGEEGLFEMVNAVPSMLSHAKEWATILNYRVLNHEPSRELYIQVLKKVDVQVKNTFIQILKEIKTEDPARFEVSVNEILSALK